MTVTAMKANSNVCWLTPKNCHGNALVTLGLLAPTDAFSIDLTYTAKDVRGMLHSGLQRKLSGKRQERSE